MNQQTIATPATISHRVVLLRIPGTYRDGISDEETYEMTRGAWRIGERRNDVEYAFGVVHGIIKGVYSVDKWHKAGSTKYKFRDTSDFDPKRWEFTGKTAPKEIVALYLGKSVKHYLKEGQRNFQYAGIWNE